MRPKTTSEIEIMRRGGQMLAKVLELLKKQLEPGMNTKDLANLAANELKKLGGQPAFLGFNGFPDVLCVSINDEIVHGIPKANKIIKDGDVVKLDFGVRYKGFSTDGAITVVAGQAKPSGDVKRLLDGTEKALYAGIDAISGEGTHIGDIGAAIQSILEQHNLGIIRELVGHGVGDSVHEDPNVPNYGHKGSGSTLWAGMTIAIEPLASLGDWPVTTASDGFTVNMADGSLSAQFEHTVAITETGAEILTSID